MKLNGTTSKVYLHDKYVVNELSCRTMEEGFLKDVGDCIGVWSWPK
jgi:hypothetical protein